MIDNPNLLRYKEKEGTFVIIDTETEGLNLFYSRPWSISWIVVRNKKIVEEHDKYIWWDDFKISKGAAMVTRFNFEEYKRQAISPREVYDELKDYIFNNDNIIVGQNYIPFDVYMVRNLQVAVGEAPDYSYLTRTYDTLALARAFKTGNKLPQDINSPKDILAFQYRMLTIRDKKLKCKLGDLCKDFQIDYNPDLAHGSLYDIYKTKEVFEQLYWGMEI